MTFDPKDIKKDFNIINNEIKLTMRFSKLKEQLIDNVLV